MYKNNKLAYSLFSKQVINMFQRYFPGNEKFKSNVFDTKSKIDLQLKNNQESNK